ncbi:MAG: hypothetical protein SGJ09_14250 [Phycisphaerae bacterium]|nr:hypothetical protein [Phycisphaerae bacterium]
MPAESVAPTFGALCSDFYVNQKLSLKLDLPDRRETVLDMFDRLRREFPRLERFRRFEGELALETAELDRQFTWVAMRQTSVRSGAVNPQSLDDAYNLHTRILEVAPYYLSISPLDIDSLELVFGFDFETDAPRDEIIFEALLADSPLSALVDRQQDSVVDVQPSLTISLSESGDLSASFEVKSRAGRGEMMLSSGDQEPISVFLTVRRQGPIRSLDDLKTVFASLCGHAERLAEHRVIPHLVVPIRNAILSRP